MVMITNYSNQTQNIVFNQTGGTGTTNCSIVAPCTLTASNTGPYCVGQTISIAATSTATGTYTWHGPGAYTATGQNPTRPGATAAMSGTYTVTLVSGTNTCTATTSVTVNSAPAISVTSTSVCAGSPGTLTASGPTSYTWNTGANTAAITATPTTTTGYTVTGGIGTCTASTVGTITVNPKPTITVNSGTICVGGSVVLTAGGASTYAWSPGTGLTGTTGTSVTANPTTSTNYVVTGTNASGCTNTVTAVVTVNPKPTITVPSSTICAGNSTILTASGASTYTWSPATGLSGTTGTSVTATLTATQNYTITGTSAAGCTNTATSAVTVNPLPTVTVTDPTICTGGTAVVTASGASTYVWSTGGNTASITVSPVSTQIYTVTGTTNSCTSTATSTVTVVTTPTVTVASATICTGGSVTLTASGSSTYVWSPASGLSGTTGTSVTAHPTATTTYTILGTAGTCTASGMAVVTVNPLPTITATSGTICLGQQTATLTASGGITYTWTPTTNITPAVGNPVTANPVSTQIYTVTGVDANGCVNTGISTVTVNSLPVITATSGTICLGQQTATLTASGGITYTWTPTTNITPAVGNPVTANPASTQIYTVTGTDSKGCVNSATTTVNVLSLPNVTATSTAICPGFSGTITASGGNTYSWNTGQNTASITQTPVSTTVYTVTGTDLHGCTDTATASITVYPTLTVTVNSSTICIGQQTANLTASGAATYVWNPTTALTPTTGANVVASPNATTVYTVTGIAGTCSATATSTVTVNPLPAIAATSGTICVGQQTTTLTASGGISYVWTTGAITPTVAVSPPTTQDYIVIGTDANGCIGSYTTSVSVLSLPHVTATSTAACPGFAGTITASGATTYTWSAGPQGTSLTESPIATTTYTVTGTDTHGCKDTASGTITVYSTFSITANSATICAAGEQTATLTVSGAATYTWTPATGLSSNTGSVVTTTPAATSTVYTIVGASAVGNCAAVTTSTLTVNPLPTPTVTSNTPCAGQQALNFNCLPANLDSYLWSGPNSYNATGPNPSIPISGVTAAVAGVYSVAVIDANMCTNTVTINVTVNPKPIISATGATVCVGQTINLSANGAGVGGFYSWNSPTSYTLTNPSDQNQSISNASLNMAGSYNVIGTDANTCQNAAFVQVVVNSLPIVTATSSTICVGQQTATLTASGASTYTWTGLNLTSTTGSPVTATPLSSGIYNVTGTDVNNCVNTATASVTVNSLPMVVTNTITPDCIPLCAVFTATATPAATSYTWNFGGGQTSNLPSPTHCFTVSGTSPVSVTIADINGCVNNASTTVHAFSIPMADFDYGPQPVSVLAPLVQFTNESTPGLPHYTWAFGDTAGVTYSATNPMHTYNNAGTYSVTLTVSSSNGCSATVVKEIIINEDYVIYVPNAFTPNADGMNEVFKPVGEGINDYKLFIFDRWGSLIFFSDDINKGWDGTYQAKGSNIVMQDVYVWKIELTNFQNVSKNLAGTVTLLK
jgi:gliding motility-associated-like protein